MKPWQFESGTFQYNEEILEHIYINKNIENFLETGNHDHNLILVGPKGVGKTLFLNLKSYLARKKANNNTGRIYPSSGQLCENLMLDNRTLGKKELISFIELSLWEKIWRLLISLICCKISNIHIENTTLKRLFAEGNSFSTLMTKILTERSSLDDYLKVLPIMTQKIETINSGVSIFIDNIDQAFSQFLTDYDPTDYNNVRNNPSIKVWTNAQTGLISAIYNINRHNSHIKVYTSIRSEAFRCIDNEMMLNYKNYTTSLKYTKTEIRKIFEKNILMMDNAEKVDNKNDNLLFSFLGVKKILHPVVRTAKGKQVKEDVFNFIYRHTMGRPRELVLVGHYLYMHVVGEPDYKKLDEKRKTERIRMAVNKVSNDIIEVYLNEIIPRFNKALLIDFIKFIQSNVIPSKHIIDNYRELLEHYFSIGIIGFAQKDIHFKNKDTFIQKFLPASEYSYKGEIMLPNTKYFLTHPCLDNYLKRTLDFRFYNTYNIIGNGRRFIDRPELTQIYDVALSYSSDERAYVEEVAACLNQKDIKVFYDVIQRGKVWGNNLDLYLQYVYKYAAKYCVLFISKSYLEKKWTKFELEQSQERYATSKGRYLLPVKFDNIVFDFGNMAFLNADEVSPSEIAEYIEAVLEESLIV